MISIEECREILGDEAHGLSDAELEVLCQQIHKLAVIVLEMARDKRRKELSSPSKKPPE